MELKGYKPLLMTQSAEVIIRGGEKKWYFGLVKTTSIELDFSGLIFVMTVKSISHNIFITRFFPAH